MDKMDLMDMKCVRGIIKRSGFSSPPYQLCHQFPLSPKWLQTWVRVYVQAGTFSLRVCFCKSYFVWEVAYAFYQALLCAYAMFINETPGGVGLSTDSGPASGCSYQGSSVQHWTTWAGMQMPCSHESHLRSDHWSP